MSKKEMESMNNTFAEAAMVTKLIAESKFEPIKRKYTSYYLNYRANKRLENYGLENSDHGLTDDEKKAISEKVLEAEKLDVESDLAVYALRQDTLPLVDEYFEDHKDTLKEDDKFIFKQYLAKFTDEVYITGLNEIDSLRVFLENLLSRLEILKMNIRIYKVFIKGFLNDETFRSAKPIVHRAYLQSILFDLTQITAYNALIKIIFNSFDTKPNVYKLFLADTDEIKKIARDYNKRLKEINSPVYYEAQNFNPSKKAIEDKANENIYKYRLSTVQKHLNDLGQTAKLTLYPLEFDENNGGFDRWQIKIIFTNTAKKLKF